MEAKKDVKPKDGNNQQVSKHGIKSMLKKYKIRTNIGIGLSLAIWILGGILLVFLSENPTQDSIDFILILGLIPFLYGCCCYAKGKGYHGAYGLYGILWVFGLFILVCKKDKYKNIAEEPPTEPDVIYRKGTTKPKDEQKNKKIESPDRIGMF